jgi:hypothetical protein
MHAAWPADFLFMLAAFGENHKQPGSRAKMQIREMEKE